MNWTPPFIALPEPYVDVDVVLYGDGDGYYRDIAFVDDQGRWQLSQGRVIFVVPLLWKPAPEIPVDVQGYIEQCQALARGGYLADAQAKLAPGAEAPEVIHTHSLPLHPGPRGLPGDDLPTDQSAWWCFTTSQLQVALDSWIDRISGLATSAIARAAVEAFLKSSDAEKLRGRQ